MRFHEIADLLHLCQGDLTASDFVLELIDNAMEESIDQNAINPLSERTPRTLQKYLTGENEIQKADAIRIRQFFSNDRFRDYVKSKLTSEMLTSIADKLKPHGFSIAPNAVPSRIANMLESCIITLSEKKRGQKTTPKTSVAMDPVATIKQRPNSSKPTVKLIETVPPDEVDEEKELDYIEALYAIYAEIEGVEFFTKEQLKSHRHHRNHFKRQRRNFYAAEDVREGTWLAYGDSEDNQFHVLKEEVHDCIIDTWEESHQNGMERLRACLKIAGVLESSKCWLCKDTDWIGVRQKQGMCHVLVNDADLEGWVLLSG